MDGYSNHLGTTVALSVPIAHPGLFSHSATADILGVLADAPDERYGIRELSRIVDTTHKTVSDAVADLEAVELVVTSHDGPKKTVRINPDRLDKPDDPILGIPQPAFHAPIRELVEGLQDTLPRICGIVVFGSVARGEADRRSDIDCFVLVEDEQATAQQASHELVDHLHDRRFDGDRYTFQVLVESVETARQYGDRLQHILTHGITLEDSPIFQQVKKEVVRNG